MSNESKQIKPDCPLIADDGNVFNIVEIAARTLNALSANADNAETVYRQKRPKCRKRFLTAEAMRKRSA